MIKSVNSNNLAIDQVSIPEVKTGSPSPAVAGSASIQETRAVNAISTPQNYQLLIKFKDNTSEFQRQAIATEMPMKGMQPFANISNLVAVTVRSNESADAVVARLKQNPQVEYIEMDREFQLPKSTAKPIGDKELIAARQSRDGFSSSQQRVRPGDTHYGEQWALNPLNSSNSGSVNAEPAWQTTVGSRDVVVAVLDTGMDYNHPDLARNVWNNDREIAGNGIDDDGNGVIDDQHGFNAVARSGDPNDDNSHGTMVSGIIGADGDNDRGVAGVNWRVKMMPVKVCDAGGHEKLTDVLAGIDYVIKMKERGVNIRVLNNSWGGDPASPALRDAIKALDKAGILFVAAAGNSTANNDEQPSYPASYDLPNVLTVAATDRNGNLAGFSNYGPKTVHIAAPGEDVLTTYPGDYYSQFGGTSGATPFVSGAAALLLSLDPTLTPEQLKSRLMESVTHNENLEGKIASGGLLNIAEAVKRTPMKWIMQGQQSDMVQQVQELLNNFGYNLATDGEFGPLTDAAVRDFQRNHGLLDDGQVGPMTMAALRGL